MTTRLAMRFGALAALVVLLGCTFPGQSPGVRPPPTVPPTVPPASVVEPSLDPALPLPSGFVLPPIVDPDGAGPPYAPDEPVQVGGLTVIYRGTSEVDGRYVALFDVTGSLKSPPGALFFLPGGPSVDLEVVDGGVQSEPFRLSAGTDPSTLFAWLVGSETLVWELGPISD